MQHRTESQKMLRKQLTHKVHLQLECAKLSSKGQSIAIFQNRQHRRATQNISIQNIFNGVA